MSEGTAWPSVVNLANSIIGVSVLAMPYCFKELGVVLGPLLLLLSRFVVVDVVFWAWGSLHLCLVRLPTAQPPPIAHFPLFPLFDLLFLFFSPLFEIHPSQFLSRIKAIDPFSTSPVT